MYPMLKSTLAKAADVLPADSDKSSQQCQQDSHPTGMSFLEDISGPEGPSYKQRELLYSIAPISSYGAVRVVNPGTQYPPIEVRSRAQPSAFDRPHVALHVDVDVGRLRPCYSTGTSHASKSSVDSDLRSSYPRASGGARMTTPTAMDMAVVPMAMAGLPSPSRQHPAATLVQRQHRGSSS